MKNKEVIKVDTHVGIYQLAGRKAIVKKDLKGCEMEITPVGVLVTAMMGETKKQVLIPYPNITGIELVDTK